MTFQQLIDKAIPTLMVAMIITSASAYLELRELIVKVTYIEKAMEAYHEND